MPLAVTESEILAEATQIAEMFPTMAAELVADDAHETAVAAGGPITSDDQLARAIFPKMFTDEKEA